MVVTTERLSEAIFEVLRLWNCCQENKKIYCTMVCRNPEDKKRSEFNSDKTKLLRSELYKCFKDDESISFCYSAELTKENDDATILKNFSK